MKAPPCILCNGSADYAAVFVPKDPAATVKPYAICQRCINGPQAQARVEEQLESVIRDQAELMNR